MVVDKALCVCWLLENNASQNDDAKTETHLRHEITPQAEDERASGSGNERREHTQKTTRTCKQ